MEGVSVRSSAGILLILFRGRPNWFEDKWLKNTFIIFPGCKVNQILKVGRTAGLIFQDCTNSSHSPHNILHTSIRYLSSPGPSFVLFPTMPFCFPESPWARAFSSPHSVRKLSQALCAPSSLLLPNSLLNHEALILQQLYQRTDKHLYRTPPAGGTGKVLINTSWDHVFPSLAPYFTCWVQSFPLWEALKAFDLGKDHDHMTGSFTMRSPRSPSKININTY